MQKLRRIWRNGGYPSGNRRAKSGRRRYRRKPLLVVFAILTVTVFVGVVAPSTDATTTTQGQTLRQQLAGKQAELKQAKSKLNAMQAELDSIAEQQNAVEVRLAELENEIARSEEEIAKSQEDLDSVRGMLEERLVGLYKQSSSDWALAEFLVEDDDLTSILDRLDTLSLIAAEDQRLFDEVEAYLQAQQEGRRQLQEQQAEQQANLLELARVQEEAGNKFAAIQQTYKALKTQISKLNEEIAKADAAAAAAAAAARQRAIQRMAWQQGKKWSNSAGGTIQPPSFTFPVSGAHSFINSWGFARSGGRTHKGCDVMAARGTPLVACVTGVISSVNRSDTGLGGISVHIKGDNGYVYYYAHLDRIAAGVYAGMRVKAGALVGYVGNSGNARGGACHLHFGMQPGGGAWVNPYATLRFYDD